MRLVIKTTDIEIEYSDEYSLLEESVKNRIESIIKTVHSTQPPKAEETTKKK